MSTTPIDGPTPNKSLASKNKKTDFIMVAATFLGPVAATICVKVQGDDLAGKALAPLIVLLVMSVGVGFFIRETLRYLRSNLALKDAEIRQLGEEVGRLRGAEQSGERNNAALLAKQGEFSSHIDSLTNEVNKLTGTVHDQAERLAECDRSLREYKTNLIRMIRPGEYLEILQRLAKDHGEGHLLLFNVELNTFINDERREQIWARVAEINEIRSVRLALPPEKFSRWRRIVTGVGYDFFSRHDIGSRFVACEYKTDDVNGEDRIAFALYDTTRPRAHHDWGALFFINRPFIQVFEKETYDYLHILEYNGNQHVLDLCAALWTTTYNPNFAESAAQIQRFEEKRLTPPAIDELLREHNCAPAQAKDMRMLVGARRFVADANNVPPPDTITLADNQDRRQIDFKLTYDYDPPIPARSEIVKGSCHLPARTHAAGGNPCVIWSSGFGDADEPTLARFVSKELRRRMHGLIEVFFTKSGRVSETTCTRTYEDMNSVVNYVAAMPFVDKSRVCVVGISLSGYLAAKLAAKNLKIASVVMVLPPLDIIAMLDNLRAQYLFRLAAAKGESPGRVPTFDDFLKARPPHRLPFWDQSELSTYFNQPVRACHMVDLATKGYREFDRDALHTALEEVTSGGRRVAMVHGLDDPVAATPPEIADLKGRIESGHIRSSQFRIFETSTRHQIPEPGEARHYGLTIPDKRELRSTISEAVEFCLNGDAGSAGEDSADEGLTPIKFSAG